jgi:hypothetical protein
MMKDTKPVNIHVSNAAIGDILDKVFHDQPLSYTISNNTIVIKEKENAVSDNILSFNPITVTGTVKDEKGEPLSGVTVTVEGSANVTSTDNSGKYTIKADSKQTLVFSFIGFKTVKRIINNEQLIDITLEPLAKDLSEVVVVGYGTQKKVNLTGAVASVGADKLESRPIINLGDGLNGLIPNLNVNLNNGQPGTGASYNVRP